MASQQASEARLQAAHKELKVVLQAAQQASEARLQAGQKDLHEIIKLSGYKLIVSMTTIFAGLLSLFGTVGGDITAPWSKLIVSNK